MDDIQECNVLFKALGFTRLHFW